MTRVRVAMLVLALGGAVHYAPACYD